MRESTRQRMVALAVGAGATALAVACEQLAPGLFERYLGPIPPIWTFLGCVLVATAVAPSLALPGRVANVPRRWLAPPALALWTLAFAISVTLIDRVAPFGRDINVPWPQAWLFYPAIAFVAEVAFHAAPLALLVPLHRRTPRLVPRWLVLTTPMLIEPIFQAAMSGPSARPAWAEVLTFLHILAINAVLVALITWRGLAHAYALRAAYYGYWHLLYGALRVSWL